MVGSKTGRRLFAVIKYHIVVAYKLHIERHSVGYGAVILHDQNSVLQNMRSSLIAKRVLLIYFTITIPATKVVRSANV